MTNYDHLLPLAKRLISGLAGKPGVHFADKNMAANYLAQALAASNQIPNLTQEELAALRVVVGAAKTMCGRGDMYILLAERAIQKIANGN